MLWGRCFYLEKFFRKGGGKQGVGTRIFKSTTIAGLESKILHLSQNKRRFRSEGAEKFLEPPCQASCVFAGYGGIVLIL